MLDIRIQHLELTIIGVNFININYVLKRHSLFEALNWYILFMTPRKFHSAQL